MNNFFLNITKNRLLVFVLIITFFTHLTYLPNGFTWLDHNDIEERKAILQVKDLGGVFFIPFGQTNFYRPLVTIVNSIDHAIYGNWAPGYHITNLALHLSVTASTFLFLSIFWDLKLKEKVLASLIFGLHPYSILIVGLVFMRQESLLVLFVILGLYLHALARKKDNLGMKVLAIFTFALGFFTKETALFVIPALIVIWEFFYRQNLKQGLRFWFWEILLMGVYIVLRMSAVPQFWGTGALPLPFNEWVGTRILLLGKFLFGLINPFKPNFSDAIEIVGIDDLRVILILLVFILTLVFIFRSKLKSSIAYAILITAILLLPSADILPVPRVASAHYGYLATIGFSVALVSILKNLRGNLKKLGKVVVTLWLTIAAFVSFTGGFQFKSDLTLFEPEIRSDPNFVEAYYFLGKYYLGERNIDAAEIIFQEGLKLDTSDLLVFDNKALVAANLGSIKFEKGNFVEAQYLYDEALVNATESLVPYIYFNQALIAQKKGDLDKVISLLEGKEWTLPEPYLLLAGSYRQKGDKNKEIETLKKVLPLLPEKERVNFENYMEDQ